MANYAIIENNIVTNVIVADTLEIAKTITGMSCIESTDINSASPGGTYDGIYFTPPNPYPSWLLNNDTRQWYPPIPVPDDGKLYLWDEENTSWKEEDIREPYTLSWCGTTEPDSPSILIDSVARSGNQFFNEVIHQAFPTAFQRWGYQQQHNADSFAAAIGKFDVVATVVRNPIDSMASSILAFNLVDNSDIIAQLEKTLKTLTAIKNNKANISIFNFDEIIANPTAAVSKIATQLNIEPEPYDEQIVKDLLNKYQTGLTYALPNDNSNLLAEIKGNLVGEKFVNSQRFVDLLNQCTDIYTELIA